MKTQGTQKFQLPDSEHMSFTSNSKWFACISKENELISIDLENLIEKRYTHITHYSFSNDGTYIAMIQKNLRNDKEILIVNLKTKIVDHHKNVAKFEWHPTKNILFAVKKELDLIQLIQYDISNKQSKLLFTKNIGTIEHLEVSTAGNAVVFMSAKDGIYDLYSLNTVRDTINKLSDNILQENLSDITLNARKPFIADDGEKIIFQIQFSKPDNQIISDVQTWDTNDPWIEPRMEMYRKQDTDYLLTVWYPESGEVKIIETENLPTAAMDVNHDFALVYNQLQYEPLYKLYPNTDLFVKNIETGETKLVCKDQYTERQFVTISPQGKYIAYFKDGDWWIYNITKGLNINLTEDLRINFQNTELQNAGDAFPYGNPAWLVNDEQIILYDQFDIWAMSPDGNTKRRITRGREENIRYRIRWDYDQRDLKRLNLNPNFSCFAIDLKKSIVMELFDYQSYKTGLALWSDTFKIEPLLLIDGEIDQIHLVKDAKMIIYRHQRYNRPISIHKFDVKKKRRTLIYQSNEKLMEFDLGTMEFIDYDLETETNLRGSLMYPTNYKPEKKYPLIVKIYERESRNINKFFPPSLLMDDGFNLLKFTTNGYFVFYPDISYTIGDPGISALKSVTSAVNKVLENGRIDKDEIGLIGHSFGGYETAFIITQTNMFAAAVAGASITDVISYYLEVDWDSKFSQMWRMENQQFRFGDSFYNMKDAYKRNSPLTYVENLDTPLLLWSGKLDTNVNWGQSVQMFLALKRLDKKAKMFLYDQEPHIIIKSQNQIHLTSNILNWMDTYVKKEGRTNKPVSRF
ncbi:MAG: prolyl oligopeptidase family serine peptidase [Aequorivita sp.]